MTTILMSLLISFSFATEKLSCNSLELLDKKCVLQNNKFFLSIDDQWIQNTVGKKVNSISFPEQGSLTEWIDIEAANVEKTPIVLIKIWSNPSATAEQKQILFAYKVDESPALLIGKEETQSRTPAINTENKWDLGPTKEYTIKKLKGEFKLIQKISK